MGNRKPLLNYGIYLLTFFVLVAIIVGCAPTPTTPAPTPTTPAPTPTPTPTPKPVEPITFKMAPSANPHDKALFGGVPQWVAEVQKRTEGRVKIDVYYAETLAKTRELADALESGLADVVLIGPHHAPGQLPLFTLGNVPGMTDDYWAKAMAFSELLSTTKALIDEFSAVDGVCLGVAYLPTIGLISKKPINTLAEVKGLKICARYPASDLLLRFGAVPLVLTPAEEYEALLRGTVEAIAATVTAVIDFKFYEVGKYFTTFNLGERISALLINKKSLAKLSPQDQKILLDLEYTKIAYDTCMIGLVPRQADELKDKDVRLLTPSAADAASLIEAAKALQEAWVKDMERKGLPGTSVMARYRELVKKYEAISPYKK